ncbi:MAG: P-loop NTPase fold protein [Clostridiaceae bacterium]
MEYYFDRDDRLDRLGYARFLETMLTRYELYRREDCISSYVIALDSPWGTGKTRFVKMLKNLLEKKTQLTEEANKECATKAEIESLFNVIYYNSWDTDFWSDALEPLVSTILEAQIFEALNAEEDYKNLRKVAVALLKGVGFAFLKHTIGEDATSIVKDTVENTLKEETDPLKEYALNRDRIDEFKNALRKVIKITKKKLVIIIDELDRCRPSFAIQTLELAKHLFDVEGLVFIFALDIEQLGLSVKTVYGNDMDSCGYLCRFFDYVGKLPSPDLEKFITMKIQDQRFYRRLKEMNFNKQNFEKDMTMYLKQLADIFSLSLRDIDTVLSTYQIMTSVFLRSYLDFFAHALYLFLLTIKCKDVNIYNRLLLGGHANESILKVIEMKYNIKSLSGLYPQITAITDKRKIRKFNFPMYDLTQETTKSAVEILETSEKESDKRKTKYIEYAFIGEQKDDEHHLIESRKANWGRVLFYDDLMKWDSIKDLTLAQYYHQQLEMFDFVLPADEAKAER